MPSSKLCAVRFFFEKFISCFVIIRDWNLNFWLNKCRFRCAVYANTFARLLVFASSTVYCLKLFFVRLFLFICFFLFVIILLFFFVSCALILRKSRLRIVCAIFVSFHFSSSFIVRFKTRYYMCCNIKCVVCVKLHFIGVLIIIHILSASNVGKSIQNVYCLRNSPHLLQLNKTKFINCNHHV